MSRSEFAQAIYEDSLSRVSQSRRRFIDDLEARAVYDDPGPTREQDARTAWEDIGADHYDPDDAFERPDGLCSGRDGVL